MTDSIDRLLTGKEVCEIRKIKKSKHYADIAAGNFPEPLHIGRRSYFLLSEVRAWLDKQIAARDERVVIKAGRAPRTQNSSASSLTTTGGAPPPSHELKPNQFPGARAADATRLPKKRQSIGET